MTKDYIKELADDILIELNEDEINDIFLTDQNLEKRFEKIINYKIPNVAPLDFPFEITNTFLRDDELKQSIPKKELLNIAPEKNDDFVIIKKVI